ncbi:MAG: radical SAM protein, partial [Leucobacter sp.]|nr:radical SAM protein [Leucobacter sp.]
MRNKKVGLISLGCAKNRVVSEQILKKLFDAGFEIVSNQLDAEIIIINTCAFIEEAQEEAINTILETNELRTEGKLKKLIVTGCLAELFKEEVRKELPEADAILGAHSWQDILKAIEECEEGRSPEYFDPSPKTPPEEERLISTGAHWAYLLIADGCDNGCTYCVIPKIRGKFKSRPMKKILREAEKLADMGYNELILVAQDLSHYGFDLYGKNSLAALLKELCKIEKLKWIRLHYIYPNEINEELIETIANEPK